MRIATPISSLRHFPVIRLFVSSTFSDLVAERNALAERVWPELERFCRPRGFTFQAIDLRWGVPSEAGLHHRTMQICFEELRRAQESSPEPNFLILLGDKYGWRPLPETISEAEHERLSEHAQSPTEKEVLAVWYRRDANAQPPQYVLRVRTDSPDGQDYTRVPDANGRQRDTAAWHDVQKTLWAIVNRAYPVSLLPQRFAWGSDDIPAIVRFQGSATEQEIWHGALRVENARDHVIAWFREIDRTVGDPEPSQLKRFIDLGPDQSLDPGAAAALAELKAQVKRQLAPEPMQQARCRWEKDASGAFTGELTTDHLAPMCEAILTRLRALILRQINDYWGADLSAEEATAAALQVSPQALELELRNHQRFALERGPVDCFVGRDQQVHTLRAYLNATSNHPLVVHGPSGSGKTALLAYVAQQPFLPGADYGGVSPLILTRFIGSHPESSTLRGVLTSLCRELRVHFPSQEPFPETLPTLVEEFYAQLTQASAGQPIYVFVDALDQLDPADHAREVLWLRSQILPLAGEAPCHGRIVATCLSPSPEFPLESEACEPFRRLHKRGLLADEELGALDESSAVQLLQRWLGDQRRGLTMEQWQQVDATVRGSSACRQPLYLWALHEQLRTWKSFKTPEPLPESLPLLIQETLTRLCWPNQHGPLPWIALGYLASARYGLSEGELLEVLIRDPDLRTQLEAAGKAHGHRLPPGANRYPIAPWARLRSDLRAYLSERAAPGTTVLSCYHRQVEQAVQTLFLADDATRAERRRLLADFFDERWDQPDAHALMELPNLFLALQDHRRLYERLTNFAFPMRKAELGQLESIPDDYTHLGEEAPADLRDAIVIWQDFFVEQAHILRRGVADQSAHKILLQLALEHADDSPVTTAAETWLSAGRCDWLRLQRVPRLKHRTPNPCRAVLEGHTRMVMGALSLQDGRVLSWAGDATLRLWDPTTGTCHMVLEGHTDWIEGALQLPDGRILSWGDTTKMRLWDVATGACLALLEGHTERIIGALWHPEGRLLSWSEDKTLRVWDGATGGCLVLLEGHLDWVTGALLLPDGRILSWSGNRNDQMLRVWDPGTGACLVVLEGHTDGVYGALLLSLNQVLSWSMDETLRIWDLDTGISTGILEGHKRLIEGALLLPNGRILSWSGDKTLRLWDAVTGECHATMVGHEDGNIGAIPLPDDKILSWSRDGTLRVWDAATGTCQIVLEGHERMINGGLSLPDGRILSWSYDNTLRIWDASSGVCDTVLDGHTDDAWGALLLPSGQILSWSEDTALRLWDSNLSSGRTVLEGHSEAIDGAMALTGDRFLTYSSDMTLRLWDAMTTGTCLAILAGHTNYICGALPISDRQILSWSESWSEDKRPRLWDATTGAFCGLFEEQSCDVVDAILLPNERFLTCSSDHTLRIWDCMTKVCCGILEGHSGGIRDVYLLPNGGILSWSHDKTLRVWDLESRVCRVVLEGHKDFVTGALPLPNGQILSWSHDRTLRVWDAETGACLAALVGHSDYISDAVPMPNDQILSWSGDKTLRVWVAKTGACRATMNVHLGHIDGALLLPDGRILSWSSDHHLNDKTLQVWDATTGGCLETLTEVDFPVRHPDWFHQKRSVEKAVCVVGDWSTDAKRRTTRLYHRLGFTPLPAWHAESDTWVQILQPDGTVLVTQVNGQVCILKLHHGNRRVSLTEAEEILRADRI
jgi:WD40 repeat protein